MGFRTAALALFACLVSLVATSAQDPDAIVRVSNGQGLGSGTVFFRSTADDAYILTNHHVAGRQGNRVGVEFWDDGKLSGKIPGVVVAARIDDGWMDVAIVRVRKQDLGELDPPAIPLADGEAKVGKDEIISTRGCPGGVWQCEFTGRTIASTDTRMEFFPRPGGGRSGSSILRAGTNEIVGLLTWSSGKPRYEDHGTDGRGYQSGNGIAQQVGNVWSVIRGETSITEDERPPDVVPLWIPVHRLQEDESDDAGLRELLKRNPQDAPAPEHDGGLIFGRDRRGPVRQFFSGLWTMFKLIIVGLAIYGAWALYRRVASIGVLLLLGMLLLPGCLWAQHDHRPQSPKVTPPSMGETPRQPPGYAQKLAPFVQRWETEQTCDVTRWGDYRQVNEIAAEDGKPVLVLVTMPDCAPCEQLKTQLAELDELGYLNDTHTVLLDSAVDPELAQEITMASPSYPVLVIERRDPDNPGFIRRSWKRGAFPSEDDLVDWLAKNKIH